MCSCHPNLFTKCGEPLGFSLRRKKRGEKSKRESAGTEAAPESVDGSPVNERCLFARVWIRVGVIVCVCAKKVCLCQYVWNVCACVCMVCVFFGGFASMCECVFCVFFFGGGCMFRLCTRRASSGLQKKLKSVWRTQPFFFDFYIAEREWKANSSHVAPGENTVQTAAGREGSRSEPALFCNSDFTR